MNKEIYRSSIFPEGESLIVDASGERTILETLNSRIRRTERRLIELENELKNREVELQSIKEQIIDRAKVEAARIIKEAENQAKTKLEETKRLAEDEGRRVGQEAGYEEGREERMQVLKKIEGILNSAKERHDEILKSAELEIVDLAVLVAEKIIRQEVKGDRGVVVATVKDALKRLMGKEEITIRINMEDLEIVKAHKDEFLSQTKGLRMITFKEDSSIERGGCRIETDFGSVDATISTQLEEIRDGLLQTAKEGERRGDADLS